MFNKRDVGLHRREKSKVISGGKSRNFVIKAICHPTNWICLVRTIFWSASSSGWAQNLLTQPQPHFSHFHLPSPLAPVRVVANFFPSLTYFAASARHSQLWEAAAAGYKLMCYRTWPRGGGCPRWCRAARPTGPFWQWWWPSCRRPEAHLARATLKKPTGTEKQLNKRLVNCFYGTQIEAVIKSSGRKWTGN